MIRRRDLGGPSAWPDVDGDVLAYALEASVVAVRIRPDGLPEQLWAWPVPERLMFLRCALAVNGQVGIVGKGHDSGAAYFVRNGRCDQLAPAAHGNSPIAILDVGADFLIRWTEPNGWVATRWPDGTITRDRIPAPWTGTALGILDLENDGTPIYTDAGRLQSIGPWLFQLPNRRSGITVGQVDGGRGIYVATADRVFCALEALDGIAFAPHLSVAADGRILVCASTSRGASLAIIDPPYPAGEEPPAVVSAIGRAFDVGWIQFGASAVPPPGNCVLSVDAGDGLVRRLDGRVIAQYVTAIPDGNIDALDRAIVAAKAARPGVPLLAYWTAGAQQQRLPVGAHIIGVEAYRRLDEPLDRYEARVRAAVAVCPTAWLIPPCYTSNIANTTDLVSVVPVCARIARDCRNVKGALVFSAGAGRATGWDEHPEAHDAWQAFVAGVAGPYLPAVIEEEFMEPWKVAVKSFDPVIARGQVHKTRVAIGNGVEVVFEKDARDELHVAVFKDGELKDRSGLARHVEVKG